MGRISLSDLHSWLRELLGVVPTLDLHGYGVKEAIAATNAFLRHAQQQGDRVVHIVYGKGHGSPGGVGVLREVVPRWLDTDGAELIERYERINDSRGADGRMKVWLRPLA